MVAERLVDSMVTLLVSSPKPQDVLAFKLPDELQTYISQLLERNRAGQITVAEREELDQFLFLEHIFRVAKARAATQIAQA